MNKNLGKTDRIIRIILGIIILAVGIINTSLLGLVGIIPLATALMGWCPLYTPFKINTCSKESCGK